MAFEPASLRDFDISGFEMWSLREDGLIAHSQGHYDRAALRAPA
jgi:hypothetical protein